MLALKRKVSKSIVELAKVIHKRGSCLEEHQIPLFFRRFPNSHDPFSRKKVILATKKLRITKLKEWSNAKEIFISWFNCQLNVFNDLFFLTVKSNYTKLWSYDQKGIDDFFDFMRKERAEYVCNFDCIIMWPNLILIFLIFDNLLGGKMR